MPEVPDAVDGWGQWVGVQLLNSAVIEGSTATALGSGSGPSAGTNYITAVYNRTVFPIVVVRQRYLPVATERVQCCYCQCSSELAALNTGRGAAVQQLSAVLSQAGQQCSSEHSGGAKSADRQKTDRLQDCRASIRHVRSQN